MSRVFITNTASFLPNEKVENDEMEEFLGYLDGKRSKSKNIVLRNNGIKGRYYALNKEGIATHSNYEMAALAIREVISKSEKTIDDVQLLCCGTSSPDQIMPSHAVMAHGAMPEMKSIEVTSHAGVCCSGMHALKYAYLSVKSEEVSTAISSASERLSRILRSETFEDEVQHLIDLEERPFIAFEKDFLRWMLSDGAGAFMLSNEPSKEGISLEINWLKGCSYANELETCMYMAGDKNEDGTVTSYKDYTPDELTNKSILSIKQDTKLLSAQILTKGFENFFQICDEEGVTADDIDHFLPHLSSFFFKDKIAHFLDENDFHIPEEKWFTNLGEKGNVGAASIYLMLDELFHSGKLKKGQKIMLVVPESSRFSYMFSMLTVC